MRGTKKRKGGGGGWIYEVVVHRYLLVPITSRVRIHAIIDKEKRSRFQQIRVFEWLM